MIINNKKYFSRKRYSTNNFKDYCVLIESYINDFYPDIEWHRKNGPARTFGYNKFKKLTWYFKGKEHRIDGPSYIDTRINIKEWYFNDCQTYEEKYWNE